MRGPGQLVELLLGVDGVVGVAGEEEVRVGRIKLVVGAVATAVVVVAFPVVVV